MTVAARIATALLPFPWLLRLLVNVRPGMPRRGESQQPTRVCQAVTRIAHWPVRWAVCLPQALAAHWMLARRGVPSHIRFGVRAGAPGLSSHAWLICRGEPVLGQAAGIAYQPVFEYPAAQGGA